MHSGGLRLGLVMAIALAALVGLGGCVSSGERDRETPIRPSSGEWANPGPFEARRIRIYPLTQFDVGGDGEPQLVVFFEVQDAWGDSVKAVGDLLVQVWPSQSSGGVSADIRSWPLPLWDGDVNASYFDPTSRMYRVPLTGLPEWIFLNEGANRDARVILDVTLTTPAAVGGERALNDSITLGRPG